ncbi:MAG: hypothetical protein WCT05_07210 [Lentisphaeria bacterium]
MRNVQINQNRHFFYDFSDELEATRGEAQERDSERQLVTFTFECEQSGQYILLTHGHGLIELNEVKSEDLCRHYVSPSSFRLGLPISFSAGQNTVTALLHVSESEAFDLSAIPAESRFEPLTGYSTEIPLPDAPAISLQKSLDTWDYTSSNDGAPMPGRFGFLKGDGVLDCAMPELGVIDKRYVSSHPKYKKAYRWGYATRPSCPPDVSPVQVNHLSVNWGSPEFQCTYSLASPGIITESNAGRVHLRELEFAGNYQYIMTAGRVSSLDLVDRDMKQNWMLLFGATEFPDLPLLIVLDQKPQQIQVIYNKAGRLSEIIFHGNKLMITATPFGMEFFSPIVPTDEEMINRLSERAVFWSHALLAYPVKMREFYRNDHKLRQTSIIQQFTYRYIKDEWATKALETAPLPPAFTLSGNDCSAYADFKFPGKYGYLRGSYGSMSQYSIPMMPMARKFPLRSVDSKIPALLNDGLDEFFSFHEQFPETAQAYPYAGSVMEPFAFASTMINFMDEDARNKLVRLTGERLRIACERNHTYDYPVIDHGSLYRSMPDRDEVIKFYRGLRKMKLWNWYERTEPYTGIKYHICYLNLGLFSSGIIKTGTPEEVATLKLPLIENDWGAGMAFYYMYLCALASGDFTPIEENWDLIKSAFSFFDKMCDWACMGTGYSDNAITWVEGANYGAFTAYVNMADAIGAKKDFEHGVYLAAKQFALRSAIFRSAQSYFHRWFEVEPWYITKGFREEQLAGFGFTHIPPLPETGSPYAMTKNRAYLSSFYNLTTEGIYPEIFDGLRELLPEDHHEVMNHFRKELVEPSDLSDGRAVWPATQTMSSMLINDVLDLSIPDADILHEIALAEKYNVLLKEWRGIHIFSRLLPKNWFQCQILAWLEMRKHPVWLEHWTRLRVEKALWDGKMAMIDVTHTNTLPGKLILGKRRKILKVTLNGKEIHFSTDLREKMELAITESGSIEIFCE